MKKKIMHVVISKFQELYFCFFISQVFSHESKFHFDCQKTLASQILANVPPEVKILTSEVSVRGQKCQLSDELQFARVG